MALLLQDSRYGSQNCLGERISLLQTHRRLSAAVRLSMDDNQHPTEKTDAQACWDEYHPFPFNFSNPDPAPMNVGGNITRNYKTIFENITRKYWNNSEGTRDRFSGRSLLDVALLNKRQHFQQDARQSQRDHNTFICYNISNFEAI